MKRVFASIIGLISVGLIILCCENSEAPEEPAHNPTINPAHFAARIDNPYFSFQDSMVYTYRRASSSGDEVTRIRLTDQKKIILGVTCVEISDSVYLNGKIQEATLDWYATDTTTGNVWYFGEYSKELDTNGVIISTEGSWEAGVLGAMPGIIMEGHPVIGDEYRQEFFEDEAEDWARVLSLTDSATVPFGSYGSCVKTEEWSAIEPDKPHEYKYYAQGIGCVLVTTVGDTAREVLVDRSNQ